MSHTDSHRALVNIINDEFVEEYEELIQDSEKFTFFDVVLKKDVKTESGSMLFKKNDVIPMLNGEMTGKTTFTLFFETEKTKEEIEGMTNNQLESFDHSNPYEYYNVKEVKGKLTISLFD